MNLAQSRIAIIGLGYVGLPLAVEFGKKSLVLDFDINAHRVDEWDACKNHKLKFSQRELSTTNRLRCYPLVPRGCTVARKRTYPELLNRFQLET